MSEFGELRSLLHGEVDRARWEELCAHLDGWAPGRLEEQALPYAAARLEGWPEDLRVAPRRWLERWASGGELGALRLTRRAEIGRGETASLEGLIRRGGWDGLSALTVRTPGELARELLASGVVSRLRALEVRHETRLGVGDVSALSTRRDTPKLERLVFDACALGEDATTALVRGGGSRSVRELEVREAAWSKRTLRALGDGAMSALGSLHLSSRPWPREESSPLGWEGVGLLLERGARASTLGARLEGLALRRVIEGPPGPGERALDLWRLGQLERLDLSRNAIDDATWGDMSAGGLPAGLARLNVGRTGLTGAALALSLESARVRELDVVEAPVGSAGALALRESGALERLTGLWIGSGGQGAEATLEMLRGCGPDLEELCVWRSPVGQAAVMAIATRAEGALRRLVLEGCDLGDAGVMMLCEANLSGLEELNLSNSRLGDASLAALGGSGWIKGVRRLNLSQGEFTRRGLEKLWGRGGLGRMRSLSLAGCGLGPDEVIELAETPELGVLVELDLSFNPIGEVGRSALRASSVLSESVKEAYR